MSIFDLKKSEKCHKCHEGNPVIFLDYPIFWDRDEISGVKIGRTQTFHGIHRTQLCDSCMQKLLAKSQKKGLFKNKYAEHITPFCVTGCRFSEMSWEEYNTLLNVLWYSTGLHTVDHFTVRAIIKINENGDLVVGENYPCSMPQRAGELVRWHFEPELVGGYNKHCPVPHEILALYKNTLWKKPVGLCDKPFI